MLKSHGLQTSTTQGGGRFKSRKPIRALVVVNHRWQGESADGRWLELRGVTMVAVVTWLVTWLVTFVVCSAAVVVPVV